MRIAILAPAPDPYVVGGAENLYAGLTDHLNDHTAHSADLIKLPVRETSLPDLVAGYEAFSRLDVGAYDAVISTKYPAWMVRHPDHSVYMLHPCRGYYDWYPVAEAGGTRYTGQDPAIIALLSFMARHRGRHDALPEFFDRFRALVKNPEAMRHPGPVGRAMIHFLDGVGLGRASIKRYSAIAAAVVRRPDYFPRGVKPLVLHPPTQKTGFADLAEDHFFTASRLYPSKRMDLLIDAWRLTDIPLPFLVAGTGMEEEKLRRHAGDDPRIRFLGFVGDEELVRLYSTAMAVPFAPADEDYGYVTLEAQLAGKPVITTNDSGGPLELVRDGVTGVVAEPTAASLAAAYRRVYERREWARELGRRGREAAQRIGWDAVLEPLLAPPPAPAPRPAPRDKVTVLNAYAIHPAGNGGQYRIRRLYEALARHVDVDLVTLGRPQEGSDAIELAPGLRELRVARTQAHVEADRAQQREAQMPVDDITALANVHLTPDYMTVLRNSLAGSRLAVLAHPYMATALRESGYEGPFVHESQNREHELKGRMLPEGDTRERLLAAVEAAERHCCREARLVYACCDSDARALLAQYGGDPANTIVVPNGTDTAAIPYFDPPARERLRRTLRLGARPVAMFLASGHRPNLEAAEHLFALAERMPDVAFAFVGNLAYAYGNERVFPENVWMVGTVGEEARNVWLHAAHVALNPMLYGGGTNLKLLDYFAAGTPVVSTDIGLRGTGAEAGTHALVASADSLDAAVREAIAGGPAIERMTRAARELVEREFDWGKLGEGLHQALARRGLV
jgi:glycosyltransferase involved in cell wall biosynthesis